MSDRRTLSEWLQFFLEAGIPASQAAHYSVSFVENRIEKTMLGDLDKDYLKELGVTVLGDVISILKHAKRVANQQNKPAEIQIIRTADGVKKSTPASRLIDHFLKGGDSNPPSPKVTAVVSDDDSDIEMDTAPVRKVAVAKRSKLRSERIKVRTKDRVSLTKPAATVTSVVKRRRVASPVVTDKLKEEVPVPKKRRVLPEHEGGYKIKMPSGTIPKTARLIAEGKLSKRPIPASDTKGVFSRLGSTPSSSVPTLKTKATKAHIIKAQSKAGDNKIAFTVTGLGKVDPQHFIDSIKMSESPDKAVFRRLGGSSTPTIRRTIKRPATSTQPEAPIALDAAPYIGVLKDGGKHATPKQTIKLAASGRDKTGFAVARLATDNVKTRLGQSKNLGIIRSIGVSPAARTAVLSVKRRLGGPSDSTVSSTTDQSSSRIRVSTRAPSKAQVTFPRAQPAGRRATQISTVGVSGSGVFSRLGSR